MLIFYQNLLAITSPNQIFSIELNYPTEADLIEWNQPSSSFRDEFLHEFAQPSLPIPARLFGTRTGIINDKFSDMAFFTLARESILTSISKTQRGDDTYLFCFKESFYSDNCNPDQLVVLQAIALEGKTAFVQIEVTKNEVLEIVNSTFRSEYSSGAMGVTGLFRYDQFLIDISDDRNTLFSNLPGFQRYFPGVLYGLDIKPKKLEGHMMLVQPDAMAVRSPEFGQFEIFFIDNSDIYKKRSFTIRRELYVPSAKKDPRLGSKVQSLNDQEKIVMV